MDLVPKEIVLGGLTGGNGTGTSASKEPPIPSGTFKFAGSDTIYYSNGQGHCCSYNTWDDFVRLNGGKTSIDHDNLRGQLSDYPMTLDGICTSGKQPPPPPLPQIIRLPSLTKTGLVHFSDGVLGSSWRGKGIEEIAHKSISITQFDAEFYTVFEIVSLDGCSFAMETL
jgi:hypothetical protein